MTPLILHLLGDYVLQSDWMALNKQKRFWPCFMHCVFYTLPFLVLVPSPLAVAFIFVTHFAIDRTGFARYVVWIKNRVLCSAFTFPITKCRDEDWLLDGDMTWENCRATGYHKDRPLGLTVWLLIAADNTLHLICNHIALTYL